MAEKKCNNCETSKVEHSLEWEMLKELTKAVKRSYVLVVTVLALWFATIGIFIWYINQYDYSNYEVSTDGGGNAYYNEQIGDSDINYGTDYSSQKDAEESPQS